MKRFHCESILKGVSGKHRGQQSKKPSHQAGPIHSIVRKFVGYDRHDSQVEVDLLNRLYRALHLLVNWFLPSQKLLHKVRTGSHITKVYDQAQTPEDFRPIRGVLYPVHACWRGRMCLKKQSNNCDQHVQNWTWRACTTRSSTTRNSWMRWPREDNPW
jgi:hypothetical protein